MGALIQAEGTRLADDVVVPSDLVVPPSDLTLEETRKLVSAKGCWPTRPGGVDDNEERGSNVSDYTNDGTDRQLGREARGIARGIDPRLVAQHRPPQYQPPQGYQPQYQQQYRRRSRTTARVRPCARGAQYPIETKPFFLTSEFAASVLAIAGIAITAASSNAFGAWRAWNLITAVVVGYMVSRGIGESGTRSNSADPREHLDLFETAPGPRRVVAEPGERRPRGRRLFAEELATRARTPGAGACAGTRPGSRP